MTEESRIPESSEAGAPEAVAPKGEVAEEGSQNPIPDDAFYSPDDPIVSAEGDIPDDAFYSPDDPVALEEDGEGVVTGMNGADARSRGKGRGLGWDLMNTAALMERLGRDLREHGMEALRVYPETEPMDAMLRSFVAGFLVGRMEEED
jgi:hypothetical protein